MEFSRDGAVASEWEHVSSLKLKAEDVGVLKRREQSSMVRSGLLLRFVV
jgi:hypothetical protein